MRVSRLLLAGAMIAAFPAAAQDAAPERVSLRYDQIRNYEPDGEEGIWFRDRRGNWYYAELIGGCPEINHSYRLGADRAGSDVIDRQGSFYVGPWRCSVGGLIRSDAPPPKRKRQEGRAARLAAARGG